MHTFVQKNGCRAAKIDLNDIISNVWRTSIFYVNSQSWLDWHILICVLQRISYDMTAFWTVTAKNIRQSIQSEGFAAKFNVFISPTHSENMFPVSIVQRPLLLIWRKSAKWVLTLRMQLKINKIARWNELFRRVIRCVPSM